MLYVQSVNYLCYAFQRKHWLFKRVIFDKWLTSSAGLPDFAWDVKALFKNHGLVYPKNFSLGGTIKSERLMVWVSRVYRDSNQQKNIKKYAIEWTTEIPFFFWDINYIGNTKEFISRSNDWVINSFLPAMVDIFYLLHLDNGNNHSRA